MGELMRIDKFLVSTGEFTRTTAKAAIRAGRISYNGEVVVKPEFKVDTDMEVLLDGEAVNYKKYYYIMLNKPAGYLSATEDKKDKTVLCLLPDKYKKIGLFPAGRLDKDAEGFLLLTNDGALAHGLMSPRRGVEKIYEADVDAPLCEDDIEAFRDGVIIDGDYKCLPARLEIPEGYDNRLGVVAVMEGRFHQVKKMFLNRGKTVTYLKRICIAGVKLDFSLKTGEFRELDEEEVAMLKKAANM